MKKTVMTETFDKWFKAQFGALPDQHKLMEMQKQSFQLALEISELNRAMAQEESLAKKYHAAILTARASEADFEF